MGEETEPVAHRIYRREREVVCRPEERDNDWMIATVIVSSWNAVGVDIVRTVKLIREGCDILL